MLTNRLKLVLGKLLSHSQYDFVEERQILDLVLIANECLDCRLKLGIPGVLYNLDWRRPIISLIGLSWSIYWNGVVFGKNGWLGFIVLFL